MYFEFALDASDIDLWDIDLLDTDLDLLYKGIPSKHFVCLQDVLKMYWRYWRYVFKTSSRHVLEMSRRRLQHNNFSSYKTSSRSLVRCLQDVLRDVLKTSWKTKNCYAEEVLKTSSRHVLKTSPRRLENQQTFAGQWLSAVNYFCKMFILHVWQGSEWASARG